MARLRAIAVAPALAVLVALGAVAALAPSPVAACSGAPAVLAEDLEAHPGRVLVARVVERPRRVTAPRAVTLVVEESLRGAGPDLVVLERPREAVGVCHDVFTVWRNARVLIALDVRPLAGGGPLTPAWLVRKDGTLEKIYDEPPWPTLDEARRALEATAPRPADTPDARSDAAPLALTFLAGIGVLAAAVVVGVRERTSARRAPA